MTDEVGSARKNKFDLKALVRFYPLDFERFVPVEERASSDRGCEETVLGDEHISLPSQASFRWLLMLQSL